MLDIKLAVYSDKVLPVVALNHYLFRMAMPPAIANDRNVLESGMVCVSIQFTILCSLCFTDQSMEKIPEERCLQS